MGEFRGAGFHSRPIHPNHIVPNRHVLPVSLGSLLAYISAASPEKHLVPSPVAPRQEVSCVPLGWNLHSPSAPSLLSY